MFISHVRNGETHLLTQCSLLHVCVCVEVDIEGMEFTTGDGDSMDGVSDPEDHYSPCSF